MVERPESLRQYVRDAVAEGDEYATPYAWVLEDGGVTYYTCKNCGRVFEGRHAFAGHCGSYRNSGCGVQPGDRQPSASSIISDMLAQDRRRRENPEPQRARHSLRQVPHRKPEPEPESARRWWWPW